MMHDQRNLAQVAVLRAQIATADSLIAEQSAAIARARSAIARAIESLRERDGEGPNVLLIGQDRNQGFLVAALEAPPDEIQKGDFEK